MSVRLEDPVLRSSRREAVAALITWACALGYTVTYCSLCGYGRSLEDLDFVLGFPDWVLWGIVAPWSVCCVLCYWFSYLFMRDEDLGGESEQGVTYADDDTEGEGNA